MEKKKYEDNSIEVHTLSQVEDLLKGYYKKQVISFNCETCGVITKRHLGKTKTLKCKNCQYKESMISKYGTLSTKAKTVLHSEEVIKVLDENTFTNIKQTYNVYQLISYNCVDCGKEVTNELRNCECYPLRCKKCKTKYYNIQHYGVEYSWQREDVKEKIKQTNLKLYGYEYANQSPDIIEKTKQTNIKKYGGVAPVFSPIIQEKMRTTCMERFGVDSPAKSEQIQEKIRSTYKQHTGYEHPFVNPTYIEQRKQIFLEKYGVENPSQDENVKQKKKETCLSHYGVEFPAQSEVIKQKMQETCIQLYGTPSPTMSEVIQQKIKKTCLQLYGSEYYMMSDDFKQKTEKALLEKYGTTYVSNHIYILDNFTFDSSWEVMFYIYCRDNNINIIRSPKPILYIFENTNHYYFPDFLLPCGYIEIKGDQFFDKEGNFINPYDRSKDKLYQAKYKCMLDNNVTILKGQDIKFFENYVNINYGKNYIKQLLLGGK